MMSDRKQLQTTINNLKSLRTHHKSLQEHLVRLEGQASYNKMKKFYDSAIDKLTAEMRALPIGHRFTGIFYVRKPYTQPTEYTKIEGTAFMREDLISWKVENIEEYQWSFFRGIYSGPDDRPELEITRDHAEAVYE